jgi:Fic family protein
MGWNWQQADWPDFRYDAAVLEPLERQFLMRSGEVVGAFRHVGPDDRDVLRIELIGDEALKTSAIEGEILDRDSVQSSLREQFGLGTDNRRVAPAERGIAEMMVDLYRHFAEPLRHETLHAWHRMVMAGRGDLGIVGGYREHVEPMQVVSGRFDRPSVHFEAPPSDRMADEMDAFVTWFNDTAPGGPKALPALARAGIAHLRFVSIHPFEDGNGRIGRALCEMALAQALGQPSLIALAYTIERARRRYYDAIEKSNKDTEITGWLIWFGETVLEAQDNTLRRIAFQIGKARLRERLRGRLNSRQEKALARLFRAGIDGFEGGLSAKNYIAITKASRATATRDLADLVAKGALIRTGERRYARYRLRVGERGE